MTNRRNLLAFATLGLPAIDGLLGSALAATTTPDASTAANSMLLDRYVDAVNMHDTSGFSDIFTATYIQHSGRSPSGLAGQITNAQKLHEAWPDLHLKIEDRIFDGDKVVARCTYTATHDHTVRGFAPTGRKVSFTTIDIWRVSDGKFAEHWDLVDTAGLDKQLKGE